MICPHCGQDSEKFEPRHEYLRVLEEMNAILGTRFKMTRKFKDLCRARYKEGFTTEDFIQVVKNMKAAWGADPKMAEYLRPVTLFGTKFDSYLNRVQPELPVVNNGLRKDIVW